MSETATARPLAGKRIAITRPPEQAAALAERLEALGARTVPLATIAIAPIEDPSALDAAIANLASYDWLVFTSVNGVAAFAGRLAATGRDWAARGLARVAAIGPATARALEERGVQVDMTPDEYVAEGILEGLECGRAAAAAGPRQHRPPRAGGRSAAARRRGGRDRRLPHGHPARRAR